ncbi:MAG: tRNA (adenosine(37)-N6)-threonylcarbamoyltransferase complex dimerization subunit type 1 TsaB [Eubacteriales bacterium]
MRILAIDSSGLVASIAIVEEDTLLGEYTIQYKKTHSQTLLPMMDELREMIELDLDTVDAIATAAGPGSFTGLRIGAATAKGLAGALQIPIIPIPTVEAMAYQLYGVTDLICPIMDARRGQVYTGIYTFHKDKSFQTIMDQCAISMDELIQQLNECGQNVILLGDATPIYQQRIREEVKSQVTFAKAFCNRQRAAVLASLGMEYYCQGKGVPYMEYVPDYLRLSQAERERLEREKGES